MLFLGVACSLGAHDVKIVHFALLVVMCQQHLVGDNQKDRTNDICPMCLGVVVSPFLYALHYALQYALQHFLVVPCTTSGPAFSLISTQKEGVRAFDGSIVPWLCTHTCQPNYFMHVTHCIADCAFSKYTKHLMSLNNPNSHSPLPTSKTYVLH